jgi:hypothetical protein
MVIGAAVFGKRTHGRFRAISLVHGRRSVASAWFGFGYGCRPQRTQLQCHRGKRRLQLATSYPPSYEIIGVRRIRGVLPRSEFHEICTRARAACAEMTRIIPEPHTYNKA